MSTSAPRKTGRTIAALKGRVFPGGTPGQRFTLLIDKLAFSVLGRELFEIWNEICWTKLSPTEREMRRRETWARFTAALAHLATADAVVVRLQASLVDEPELFVCLLDVVFSDLDESGVATRDSPNRVLPPGLRVRQRPWAGPWDRTPWRHSTRTVGRALGWIDEPVMAPIAGLGLVKVLAEILWHQRSKMTRA
jgi:hypothetical protein